jgi:hypothetical protein
VTSAPYFDEIGEGSPKAIRPAVYALANAMVSSGEYEHPNAAATMPANLRNSGNAVLHIDRKELD